jgi:hypothetical protein
LVWVIVFALIGGLLGFVAAHREKQTWVAQSLVVPTDTTTTLPSGSFSDTAAAIFPTDAVLGQVISDLKLLDATPRSLIASGALTLQPTPGGLAVRVIGRDQDQSMATNLATDAATQLSAVGATSGLGQTKNLQVQSAQLQPKPTARYVAAGVLAGALVGVAIVALLYLLRVRPRRAEDVTTPMVTVRVRVEPDDQRTITPVTSLTGLWFGFVSPVPEMDVTGIMIEEGNSAWAVTAVADELSSLAANDHRGTISWRPASEHHQDAMSDRVLVLAPATMSARVDDVRREVASRAPSAFVALVLVIASGPH